MFSKVHATLQAQLPREASWGYGKGLPCSAGRCGVATMIRSRCCFILIRVTLTQRGVIVQLRGVKPVRNCPPHGAHVCPLRS